MATGTKNKAVKVPHGTPIPEGMDLDTSEYVNEVGPYDDDITKHPQFHENMYAGSAKEPLAERIDRLKQIQGHEGEDLAKVEFQRLVNTRTGAVTATLAFPSGDRFGAQGRTTEEAVGQLEDKLMKLFPTEEVAK